MSQPFLLPSSRTRFRLLPPCSSLIHIRVLSSLTFHARAHPLLSMSASKSTTNSGITNTSASISTTMSSTNARSRARPRRFAPLDTNLKANHGVPRLKGVIFDVDGTLCLPQNYMFREMRSALDIPKSVDILDHIRTLSDEPDETPTPSSGESPSSPQSRAVAKIQSIERNAMTKQRPQPGLQELMAYLSNKNVPKALCTRNFPAPVHHLLDKYLPTEKFGLIITRDTEGVAPKPSPEGIWKIAQSWDLHLDVQLDDGAVEAVNGEGLDVLEVARENLGHGLIMVGDSIDDMAAGYRAGAATVLLANEENEALTDHEYTDLSIRRLDELIDVLEKGFKGKS